MTSLEEKITIAFADREGSKWCHEDIGLSETTELSDAPSPIDYDTFREVSKIGVLKRFDHLFDTWVNMKTSVYPKFHLGMNIPNKGPKTNRAKIGKTPPPMDNTTIDHIVNMNRYRPIAPLDREVESLQNKIKELEKIINVPKMDNSTQMSTWFEHEEVVELKKELAQKDSIIKKMKPKQIKAQADIEFDHLMESFVKDNEKLQKELDDVKRTFPVVIKPNEKKNFLMALKRIQELPIRSDSIINIKEILKEIIKMTESKSMMLVLSTLVKKFDVWA